MPTCDILTMASGDQPAMCGVKIEIDVDGEASGPAEWMMHCSGSSNRQQKMENGADAPSIGESGHSLDVHIKEELLEQADTFLTMKTEPEGWDVTGADDACREEQTEAVKRRGWKVKMKCEVQLDTTERKADSDLPTEPVLFLTSEMEEVTDTKRRRGHWLQRRTSKTDGEPHAYPEMTGSEPQPEMSTCEAQPKILGSELQPEMSDSEPQPEMSDSEPEPEMFDSEPQPEMSDSEPQPEMSDSEPLPEMSVGEPSTQPVLNSEPHVQPQSFGSEPCTQPNVSGDEPDTQSNVSDSKLHTNPAMLHREPCRQPEVSDSEPHTQPNALYSDSLTQSEAWSTEAQTLPEVWSTETQTLPRARDAEAQMLPEAWGDEPPTSYRCLDPGAYLPTLYELKQRRRDQQKLRQQRLRALMKDQQQRRKEADVHEQDSAQGQPSASESDKTTVDTADRPFKCAVCNKTYKREDFLKKHQLIHTALHTGHRPFMCDVCGKTFKRGNMLRNHERIHTGEKPYECDICEKRFTQLGNLKTHKMINHSGQKPFACDFCDKRFAHPNYLKSHKRTHTDIPLPDCTDNQEPSSKILHQDGGQQSSATSQRQSSALDKTAVAAPHRPFVCVVCNKTFKQADFLRKHKVIHTGEKPYSCDICKKRFTQSSSVKAHKMIVHSSQKPFACDICDKTFPHPNYLKMHKKTHTDEKPCTERYLHSKVT